MQIENECVYQVLMHGLRILSDHVPFLLLPQ